MDLTKAQAVSLGRILTQIDQEGSDCRQMVKSVVTILEPSRTPNWEYSESGPKESFVQLLASLDSSAFWTSDLCCERLAVVITTLIETRSIAQAWCAMGGFQDQS